MTGKDRLTLLAVGREIKGSKSDKIRWLLEAGFTRGEIAAALGVPYQMVFQVEKRMIESQLRRLRELYPKHQPKYYWEEA